MIRAIVRDGLIHPLDPIPDDWAEGRELRIEGAEPDDDPEAIDRWYRDLSASAARRADADEWPTIESALDEADRDAKAWMRREMGLE